MSTTDKIIAVIGVPAFAFSSLPLIGIVAQALGYNKIANVVLMAFFNALGAFN